MFCVFVRVFFLFWDEAECNVPTVREPVFTFIFFPFYFLRRIHNYIFYIENVSQHNTESTVERSIVVTPMRIWRARMPLLHVVDVAN